jgi:hypothetical protein
MQIEIVGTGQMGRTLGARLQIGPMGIGRYATLSVHVLPVSR